MAGAEVTGSTGAAALAGTTVGGAVDLGCVAADAPEWLEHATTASERRKARRVEARIGVIGFRTAFYASRIFGATDP